MSKLIWNTLKLSPLLLTATLFVATRTQAAEPLPLEEVQQTSVTQLSEEKAPETLAQVTSVSQLSDVQPTDWAFQALQSLVERYGCIAGYPDGTYRGNRALTRYEFAAGLNACLDRVNELIATASADMVNKEDLATLQRLQEEFSAELATLRGRVDALEARTAELEANQFSTTTKLSGEVIVAVSDVFGGNELAASGSGEPTGDDNDVNTVLADRARLTFNTSFTGKDELRTRLQARNVVPFGTGLTGTNMTRLGFDGDEGNDVQIDDFYYKFPLGEIADIKVDFDNGEFNDNVFTFNPLLESSGRGAISRFGRFNPIYRAGDGAGLTINLNPKGVISASASYLARNANDPTNSFGLFNGDYAALGQIAFRPSDNIAIGATYVHTYDNSTVSDITATNGISVSGATGSVFSNNPFSGASTSTNQYAVQASFKLGGFTLGGWGGYTVALNEDSPSQTADIWNWAATLALQDVGKEGSVLGLVFGQPPRTAKNDFGGRRDQDTSYHLEGLYRFPLTDNIDVTPGVIVIFNPEHNDNNDTVYVGTLRTTFRF
ncbi:MULTISPECIES: iron uptake porin [Chroococcidiopsis]|uniref:Cyanobacterial porin n=1 Tax=Chroococcidiopsis thermalis (strain PCC 7203) TaxID=251229 RepID=K9TX49_CHRTP|nr:MULTISPECIES: iron uptake porin [Chroococcidiopsis]AFY86963.1 cyanobacterial porin [Chroococcidiopsis thermalis PCC 7203]URD51824.1 iron uptake porin [Chroococcidiopsis sp. CCNUC1]